MQESKNWMERYYTPDGLQALHERLQTWTPELQAEIGAKWLALYAEVQLAIDTNLPLESLEARNLGKRWFELTNAFTQGNPELSDGVRKLFADRQNWPQGGVPDDMIRNLPKPEHTAWLGQVMKAQLMASN